MTGVTGVKIPQVAVFIDWHNTFPVRHMVGKKVNLDHLLAYVHTLGNLHSAFVFMADFRDDIPEHERTKSRIVRALENRGFVVKRRVVKRRHNPDTGKVIAEGNLDVEITIAVMKTLRKIGSVLDKVVLFTGDGDFLPLVAEIQKERSKNPIRTLVISREREKETARDLVRQSDKFLPLESVIDDLLEPRYA